MTEPSRPRHGAAPSSTGLSRTRRRLAPIGLLALSACASAPPDAPTPRARVDVAREAIARGDVARADSELKLALQTDPIDAESHHLLACLLAQRGEREQALVGFRRAVTIDPVNADAAYNAGTLHLMRGEAVPAARLLENAALVRPGDPRTYNNLAKAYFLAGLPELSCSAYEETLRTDPANVVALRGLATITAAAGMNDAAAGYRRRLAASGAAADLPAVSQHAAPSDDRALAPVPAAPPSAASPAAGPDHEVESAKAVLRDLKNVRVERRGHQVAVHGWTTGASERELLDRVLKGRPDLLDLTNDDAGDPRRMVEVDATIFVVIEFDTESLGFNFLRFVNTTFSYFATDHQREGKGFTVPGSTGDVTADWQQGWMFSASVDYDVNIANAAQDRVAVLARPHLTTLSGTPARFLAGGEYVFRVSGNISGDIKPYPFGTNLSVTPTLLREPTEEGTPRIHMKVDAGRTSVLALLSATDDSGSTVFDKVEVSGEAVLGVGQTLILSGLAQRESRTGESGVPILSSIPVVKWFFSQQTVAETNTAVVILLTPRDPGYVDERNRQEIAKFVEKRRAYVEARREGEEGIRRFKERFPDWAELAPNRFATHFFMTRTSELYRAASGQNLDTEALEFDLLGSKESRESDR